MPERYCKPCRELEISPDEGAVGFEPATEDDARTIIELRKQIWATTYRGVYPDSMIDGFDDTWHLKKELQRIRNPQYRVYRIVKDDCSIGYLSTRKTDVVILQSLYILEEYQHQGIGRSRDSRAYCEIGRLDSVKVSTGPAETGKGRTKSPLQTICFARLNHI